MNRLREGVLKEGSLRTLAGDDNTKSQLRGLLDEFNTNGCGGTHTYRQTPTSGRQDQLLRSPQLHRGLSMQS